MEKTIKQSESYSIVKLFRELKKGDTVHVPRLETTNLQAFRDRASIFNREARLLKEIPDNQKKYSVSFEMKEGYISITHLNNENK